MIWLWSDGFVSSCRLKQWVTTRLPECNPLLFARKQLTSILSVNGAAMSSICGPEMFTAGVSVSCSTGRVNVVALAWSFFIAHLSSQRSATHLTLHSPTTRHTGQALYRAACLSGWLPAGCVVWSYKWRWMWAAFYYYYKPFWMTSRTLRRVSAVTAGVDLQLTDVIISLVVCFMCCCRVSTRRFILKLDQM